MRFDLWTPTANPFTTPELLALLGREAEERQIGTLWVGEHVVLFDEYRSRYPYAADGRIPAPPGSGLLEPLNTLSFLAACTTTVRLGTAMILLPQRNPVYTAKEVSTLDWLSRGRVDLGVGVGWLEEEFEAVNVPWPERGARTDEYLGVLATLWTDDPSGFSGDFYSLPPCSMFPKPVQPGGPPIHIGGESDAALRRAARCDGWHTFNRSPEDLGGATAAARSAAGRGGPRPAGRAGHRLPLLCGADPRPGRAVRRGRGRRAWPPCSSPAERTRCRPCSTPSSRAASGRSAC